MAIEKYATAVRDGVHLFLFMWIKRSEAGDFYAFLPRPHDKTIDAHSSYHADGQFHFKSHGTSKIMHRRKQKPDHGFAGTEHLLDQTIVQTGPRSIGQECDPGQWTEVFEIPVSDLDDEASRSTHITADLSDGHAKPELVPNARVIRQAQYRHSSPFLVFTFYEMPQIGP